MDGLIETIKGILFCLWSAMWLVLIVAVAIICSVLGIGLAFEILEHIFGMI